MKKVFLSVILFSVVASAEAQNSSPYWSLAGNSNATGSSKLGTTNATNLRLFTNNAERLRITPTGNVGIGTTAPSGKLNINSAADSNALRVQVNGYTKLLVHSSGGVAIGASATPPANGLFVSGSVGIGIKTPGYKLHVIGSTSSGSGAYVSGYNSGVRGIATSTYGTGVYGEGQNAGVEGVTSYRYGVGVSGEGYIGVVGTGSIGIEGIGTGGLDAYGGYFESAEDSYAGYFNGVVYATGSFQSSDFRLKRNIKEFQNAMSIINQLKPKNYEFKNDGIYGSLHLPKGNHYGLIAQELETVLPNLVKESKQTIRTTNKSPNVEASADGKSIVDFTKLAEPKPTIDVKAVNYTELIPIVIKGMQELSKQNEELINASKEQQKEIEDLKVLVKALSRQGGNNISSSAFIKQNVPNPSGNNTIISYYTPNDTKNAQILVTDMKGSVVKAFTLSNGEGQVNIGSRELSTGIYNYTLYINNNSKIDTKQMIITK